MLERDRKYTSDEPPKIVEEITFRKSASTEAPSLELDVDDDEAAKEHVHLGDLLYGEGRPKAAAIQYRKASALLGEQNPILQTRIGRTLLEDGEVEAAIDAMMKAYDAGERYMTLYVYLGEAYTKAERYNEAYAMLREAMAFNPFHPSVHKNLAKVYEAQGQDEQATRALEWAQQVGR